MKEVLTKKELRYLASVESAEAKRYEIIYKGKHVETTRAESLEELKELISQSKHYKDTSDVEIYDVSEGKIFSFKELFENYSANKIASFNTKLKANMKLKSGDVIPSGTVGVVKEFINEGRGMLIQFDMFEEPKRIGTSGAYKKFSGFTKPPSMKVMERWMEEGVAKTITGKRTEPDGYGSDGSPSWLLVMGLI